jgi:hypothetical protein
MAVTTTGVLVAAALASAVTSVASGYSAKQSARKEAGALKDQANLAAQEAQSEARRRADEVRRLSKKQKLAFIKNGVTLEGSPLLTIDETLRQGQEEVDAISRRGYAIQGLYNTRADITNREGRAQFIGGIGSGLSTLATTGASVYGGGGGTAIPKDSGGGAGSQIVTTYNGGYATGVRK